MNATAHTFELGSFRCTALYDGEYTYSASRFIANGEPGEVAAALAHHNVEPDRIPSPYTCLLVETGREVVLLDTGGRDLDPGVGKLEASLRAAGFDPARIDVVVLTHGHPDHIGGNTDAEGKLTYPNARHVMAPAEWSFWTSEESLVRVPEHFREIARKNLPPIEAQLSLVDGEREVVPGIWMLPTPGHTPGHVAVIVEQGGEQLLYISDAVLHPMHLEHPAWHPTYDLDPAGALASKRMLFDRAAHDRALVLAYHFDPFPSLGHVSAEGSGWRWEALAPRSRPAAAPGATPQSPTPATSD